MNKFNPTKYTLDIHQVMLHLESMNVEWSNQLAVTSRSGDDLFDGIGSINDYHNAIERDFCNINRQFQNTEVSRLLEQLINDGYALGRVRILRMYPRTAYSYHMDCETRLHFALETSDQAMFIIDDEVFRVPADGNGYLLNTTSKHTAINCGLENRIHLVIDLLYPVTRIGIDKYKVLDRVMTQSEFDKWLVETKPPTESQRMDYFYV